MTPPYKVSESLVARLGKTSMGESISISISIIIIGVILRTVVVVVVVFTFSKLCELLKSLTVVASVVVGPLKAVEECDNDSNFKANDDLYFDRAVSLLIALTPLPRVTVSN